jgi:tRNA A-37 threonylcarbamoyl transferase component Bud32
MATRSANEVDLSVYKPETDGVLLLSDRYELTEFLSQGGMGRLYVAKDRILNRAVVVKILLPQYLDNKRFAKRFQREAQTLSKINHPHLLAVHDYGVFRDNYPYIVTEYIRGISLGEMIGDRGRIPLAETVEIMSQVCDGLHAAHQQGIVHRDMKPENILVTRGADEEWVKVIDFGLAVESFQEQTRLTVSGSFLGTMPYMAPEQFDRADVDARTDVYALGIIFYEMLTGTHPYHATSIHQFYLQHAEAPIPKFEECVPPVEGYMPELQDILEKAIAKKPEDRYPNMVAFKRDLRMATGARVSDIYALPPQLRAEAETITLEPRHRHMGVVTWVNRYFKATQKQWQRIKLLGMMLFVAFATAVGMMIFERMVGRGMPAADVNCVVIGNNVQAVEFYEAPSLRLRIKGTARNCGGKNVQIELRVMDSDGRPLALQIPADREKYRKWPRFKKEKGNFGFTFEAKPEDAFYSFTRTVDLPYFLFVPPASEKPFTFFVSARVLTSTREALALKDTDFLEAPAHADFPLGK